MSKAANWAFRLLAYGLVIAAVAWVIHKGLA